MHIFTVFLFLFIFSTLSANDIPIPKATDKPAENLAHYLEFLTQNHIDFACNASKRTFECVSEKQLYETTENNVTTAIAFDRAALRFNASAAVVLEKARFDAAMKEINATQQLRKKYLASQKPYLAPPSSPLQDALDRTLAGNLEQVAIDTLDVNSSQPKSHLHVKRLTYANAMKRTAKDAAFSERIFGTLHLQYKGATFKTEEPDSAFGELPRILEAWLETNDTRRSDYVGQRLGALAKAVLDKPFDGSLKLTTDYLGSDAMSIHIEALNQNADDERDRLDFQGELRGISTLFAPARRPQTPGSPDFLFRSLRIVDSSDITPYRDLLKKDKRFSDYIHQYDGLIKEAFAKRLKKYAYSPVISGWLTSARDAFSKMLLAKADTLEVKVSNRNGMTAMQVFGMLMGQLMLAPQTPQQQPDSEKIILDTAATHLDVKIEAK